MTKHKVLLVGAGQMAQAYAKVLTALSVPFIVFGRGEASAASFEEARGLRPFVGPLGALIEAQTDLPRTAIVAVNAQNLFQVTQTLLRSGVSRILVEKPAGLNSTEVNSLAEVELSTASEVYVAYNRRFYASTTAAKSMIDADGGVISVKFDFTEATRRIEILNKPEKELNAWFFGNSTHVIDMAFFLAGTPAEISAKRSGKLSWHDEGAVFIGHGRTTTNALISYHANWLAPGRWGVEVMTERKRYVLQPLEQLFVQEHGSFALKQVELNTDLDTRFKPGIYHQVRSFLSGQQDERLLTIGAHARLFAAYAAIRSGTSFSA
ncbi:gfo/Idh/MocA family oxidoreductase [Stappia sp. GBMRC 2046]|uniref:Gfo/Idh/MocA family oxidoreductase n=1 Tax=Stappia sediminis TaxID=2692190 RepID=A0A7X3S8A4_9HYPH|nr:Gfo/Idh/MocA family oxidoreductase [Stappia sediminis]MXN65579.1 gfo/Idh/MocA family oxidoreductase [Stappia sediminis]